MTVAVKAKAKATHRARVEMTVDTFTHAFRPAAGKDDETRRTRIRCRRLRRLRRAGAEHHSLQLDF